MNIRVKAAVVCVSSAPVVLDLNTAHPDLVPSQDLTAVRKVRNAPELPDNPERSEGFDSGSQRWRSESLTGGVCVASPSGASPSGSGPCELTHIYTHSHTLLSEDPAAEHTHTERSALDKPVCFRGIVYYGYQSNCKMLDLSFLVILFITFLFNTFNCVTLH